MPGATVLIGKNLPTNHIQKAWARESTNYADSEIKHSIIGSHGFIGVVTPDGYPNKYIVDTGVTVFEGICYGVDPETVIRDISEIKKAFLAGYEVQSLIRSFMNRYDGEYACFMLNKEGTEGICFNDPLGRLSIYYGCGPSGTVVSRQLRSTALFSGLMEIDRYTLADNLLFGFPIGDRTFFKDVKLLPPGALLQISSEKTSVEILAPLEFAVKEPYPSVGDAIDDLAFIVRTGTEARIRTGIDLGRTMICDLSGGFDSRALIAMLAAISDKINYVTLQYVQDESAEAFAAFEAAGSRGQYKKLELQNAVKKNGLSRLLLRTDGLANYYTTSVCFQDVDKLRSTYGANSFRFGGLGGEFIRHPYLNWRGSILGGANHPLYSALPTSEAARLVGIDPLTYSRQFMDSGKKSASEKQTELRKYYYNYYIRYVGHSGGEREREQLWPVHPLWSKPFVDRVFTRIPLKWIGFEFFASFVKKINPAVVSAPIFRHGKVMNNRLKLLAMQKRYNLKNHTQVIRSKFLRNIYKMLRPDSSINDILLTDDNNQMNKLQEQLFGDKSAVYKNAETVRSIAVRRRMLSTLMFIEEFSNRYGKSIGI